MQPYGQMSYFSRMFNLIIEVRVTSGESVFVTHSSCLPVLLGALYHFTDVCQQCLKVHDDFVHLGHDVNCLLCSAVGNQMVLCLKIFFLFWKTVCERICK